MDWKRDKRPGDMGTSGGTTTGWTEQSGNLLRDAARMGGGAGVRGRTRPVDGNGGNRGRINCGSGGCGGGGGSTRKVSVICFEKILIYTYHSTKAELCTKRGGTYMYNRFLTAPKAFAGRGTRNGVDALRGRIFANVLLSKVADVNISKIDIFQNGIVKSGITKHCIDKDDVCQICTIKGNTVHDSVCEISVPKAGIWRVRLGQLSLD